MDSTRRLPELESLRAQVADLARELAERDDSTHTPTGHLAQVLQDLQQQTILLRTIIESAAAETGDECFASLVTHLASTLQVQYAVVGEVSGDRTPIFRTLAVSAGGTVIENFEYALEHAPCVTGAQAFWCFEQGVQTHFPHFLHLTTLGVESLCGVPLRTKTGTVVGLLMVMDTKPLPNSARLKSLMEACASRATVELHRHHAERALRHSERRRRVAEFAVDHSKDGVIWTDESKRFIYANASACRMLGYTQDELLKLTIPEMAPGLDDARFPQSLDEIKQGLPTTYGSMLQHRDGGTFPVEVSITCRAPEGREYLWVFRDITERKYAEQELKLAEGEIRQQRRHLVMAQALTQLGSWEWDLTTDEFTWSEEHYRIFGHEPGAIVVTSDTWLTALHPDDHDRALAAINHTLAAQIPLDLECRIVRPNGEVRIIHTRGNVHRNDTGHPTHMDGTVLDVTEHKKTEEALRASEDRWQLAVRASHDGIWDWNIQTGEAFFSSRWKAMRGLDGHPITNHVDEWRSRIHPDDLDGVFQQLEAYLAKQHSEFFEEYRAQKQDGSYIWILNRGLAVWDASGTPLRMVGWGNRHLRARAAR